MTETYNYNQIRNEHGTDVLKQIRVYIEEERQVHQPSTIFYAVQTHGINSEMLETEDNSTRKRSKKYNQQNRKGTPKCQHK